MKKIFAFIFVLTTFIACKNENPQTTTPIKKNENPQTTAPIKTQKKVFNKIKGAEIKEKFDLDVEIGFYYEGFYEYKTDTQNIETLNGNFLLRNIDIVENFHHNSLNFTQAEYTGMFKEGAKEGLFLLKANHHETVYESSILYANGQCTNGTCYYTDEDIRCYNFNGKLTTCTFSETIEKSKSIDCK